MFSNFQSSESARELQLPQISVDLQPPFKEKNWRITADPEHFLEIDLLHDISIPIGTHPGAFGAVRKYHVHEGVDLYVPVGEEVYAMEVGTVVAIQPFTGSKAGSPWWLDTMCVLVEGKSGVINYGEILPSEKLRIGDVILAGDLVGKVAMVLAKDKGRPRSMLHLELYEPGVASVVEWMPGAPKPSTLRDPTFLLLNSLGLENEVLDCGPSSEGMGLRIKRNVELIVEFRKQLLAAISNANILGHSDPQLVETCQVLLDGSECSRPSAIMVPFAVYKGEVMLLLTERSSLLSTSPGAIVFPGGRVDGEESTVEAAIREMYEEVGLKLEERDILGELPGFSRQLKHRYWISPVIALFELEHTRFNLSKSEVEKVILLPLTTWITNAQSNGALFPVDGDGKHMAHGNAYALEVLRRGLVT